jgi:DNA processing protein
LSVDLREWLALRLTKGVGDASFHRLVGRFGSPGAVFGSDPRELADSGLPEPTAVRLAAGIDPSPAEAQLRQAECLGARVLCFGEEDYPAGLTDLPDPPPVLWTMGKLPTPGARRVGIVGTRAPDGYGLAQALRLSSGCARSGCWILSGGARGVDAAAHEGALGAGGSTLVVLGSGLDVPYPGEHRELFARVVQAGGAVVSEQPLGTRPSRGTFPRRNRLIGAMSEVLVVVQAGARSGALLTAAEARRLGRHVLAVPGPVDRDPSAGVHRLIREGAGLCEGPQDILSLMGVRPAEPAPARGATAEPVGEAAARVLAALSAEALPFDQVASRSGLEVAQAAEALLELELGGAIGLERGFYHRKRE